jgi:hypothetical protein
MDKTFARMGGSIVPTIAKDFAQAEDPYERDARGFVDMIRKRIPGLRQNVPIMRNMLGEPVTKLKSAIHPADGSDSVLADYAGMAIPLAYSKTSSSIVDNELKDLYYGFTPPSYKMNGSDLREYPDEEEGNLYYKYQRLAGTIKHPRTGHTLREALEEKISDPRYQRMDSTGDEASGLNSPRIAALMKVIGRYRRAAKYQLIEEHPELKNDMIKRKIKQRSMLLGVDMGDL